MPKNLDDEIEKIDDSIELETIEGSKPPENNGGVNDNDGGEGQGGGEGGEGDEKKTVTREQLTPEKIAELSASITERMMARQRQNTPKQEQKLTQDQIDKMLNPVRITKEFLIRHGKLAADADEATVKANIAYHQELADMQTKHHTSLLQVAQEHLRRQLTEQASPMFDYYQRAQQERDKQEFFKEFPKLAKFGKIVQFAASTIQPTDAQGNEKSVAAVKKEIAQAAKDLLKESGVDIDALATEEGDNDGAEANLSAEPGKRNIPKMVSMSSSGRSGGPQAKGGGNNPDADIYT